MSRELRLWINKQFSFLTTGLQDIFRVWKFKWILVIWMLCLCSFHFFHSVSPALCCMLSVCMRMWWIDMRWQSGSLSQNPASLSDCRPTDWWGEARQSGKWEEWMIRLEEGKIKQALKEDKGHKMCLCLRWWCGDRAERWGDCSLQGMDGKERYRWTVTHRTETAWEEEAVLIAPVGVCVACVYEQELV